ncbi:MAG TPA: hypothetical protein VE843_02980, partial [Ktedonobacteraceae bacterium]|nr:hypothetical protein [Ktedonobacteraceae bacterium]
MGLRFTPPISTNLTAIDFDDPNKYATMITNKSRKRFYYELSTFTMLLKALIVRSTTQKDEMPFRTRSDICLISSRPGYVYYH